jgi:tetratricopeptide (TPR) repeat protein
VTGAHPSDDALLHFAEGNEDAAVVDHLLRCTECADIVKEYRDALETTMDKEAWHLARKVRGDEPWPIAEFHQRTAREDAEARELVKERFTNPYAFTATNVTTHRRYWTGGVVRLLIAAAGEQCRKDAQFALQLADAAQFIASALPDDHYPAGAVNALRGNAWKTYATACRYLAKFADGYDACRRAERAFQATADPLPGLAATKLVEAILLWKQERYAEALPIAESAAADLVNRRLPTQYVEAKEVIALILHAMGNVGRAVEVYREAYLAAETLNDLEMRARAAKNLGVAFRDAGDAAAAAPYFLEALQIFEGLGQDALVLRMRWSIALVLLATGKFREAAGRLASVHAELSERGMRGDAAKVNLDRAEAHLALGELEVVESLSSDLMRTCAELGTQESARTALAYLREAAAARRLTLDALRYVRRFVEHAAERPALAFLPPSDEPRQS